MSNQDLQTDMPWAERKHSLVGWAFLRFENGRLKEQGEVVDVLYDGADIGHIVLVQFYEWIFGAPTYIEAIRMADLTGNGKFSYRLFKCHEHRNEYYSANEKRFDRIDDEHIARLQEEAAE